MSSSSFYSIEDVASLVGYLSDTQRLNNVKVLNKYTSLSSAMRLFSTGLLLINNPMNMNDLYEYKAFSPLSIWDKICFCSFITRKAESMAMWSMYAQPWTDGVMLSVPTSIVKRLVQDTQSLICAKIDQKTGWYSPSDSTISSVGLLSLSRIAYIDGSVITCTGRDDRNIHFPHPYEEPGLAGFVKDAAWDYEKEVRLRVDLPDDYNSTAVYLQLPDYFLNEITITTGPRFEGNVLLSLPKNYRATVKIERSKFSEKLAWIPCDTCSRKGSE